jgi:hypothetical protein
MRLNLERWKPELRNIEAELKRVKSVARHPPDDFAFSALFSLKAQATRLYCLRRHLRGQLHAIGRLRRVVGAATSMHDVADLASQEALLKSDPAWLEAMTA